ncbi:MAG: response regulator [Solirubrobacterales bacterium]
MPKILSIDDSTVMRKIIRQSVEAMGYELLEAKDGHDALGVLNFHHEDVVLILLDWNMPVMDGYEFLNRMKQIERFSHIKVMMVTTKSEKENVVKAITAGACHYVIKPFSKEDLIVRIMEALGRK